MTDRELLELAAKAGGINERRYAMQTRTGMVGTLSATQVVV